MDKSNIPIKGITEFFEEEEKKKQEEQFADESDFYTNTKVNSDKSYKEDFDKDQTFLQKTGKFVKQVLSIPDQLDKAVGIYGTRQNAIKALTGGLSEDHLVAALAGEMLVPDTIDLITLGLGYVPRRVLIKGPKAIKMFLKFKKSKLPKAAKGSQALPDLGNAGKLASDADYDAMAKAVAKRAGIEGKNVDDALSEAGLVNRVDTDPSDFSKVTTQEYEDIVLKGMERMGMQNGVFDLDLYNQNSGILAEMSDTLGGAVMKSGQRRAKKLGKRNWMEYFLSPQTLKGNFEALRKEGKIAADIEWEDFLKGKGLTVQDIQVHHINPLYDSIHLFDGVKWGSDEYWEIISTLINMGARPGIVQRGDDVTNVIRTLGKSTLTDTPHGIAHAYYKDIVPEFFSAAERLNMKLEPGYRIRKTKEWAKIVNQSEDIVVKAHKAWEALNPKSRMPFDELIDQMGAYDNKGILKGISLKYQVKDIQELVKQINFEAVIKPLPSIKFPNVSEIKQRMLLYKAQPGVTWKMVKKKFPGFNYEQLDLFD